ncbi:glycosyltransferase family 39 protein [Synoicihabitans lomoniglobus]|uniref:Glycosyltransferase family 39 protein n=1 Tax=Synoicihabitans lomoniglobus TaxID=2909285 RepID=A0AAF0I5P4_9BACT|nr:glycosyltransferase family 39 protein [Opitutaceae bacterium LMO-M01]WED67394.1 glycosyltransferase family 39 protein [Opitutaceae bacterium LMO-M01]
MEFPSYQLLTATASELVGGNIVIAGRGVSVLAALLTLPALWLLMGYIGLSPTERAFTLALLLVSPLYAHYARAVLIETWATALACWWLAAFVEALHREKEDPRWLIAATIVGVVAAMTKITTFAVVLPPAALIVMLRSRDAGQPLLFRAGLMTLPALIAGAWWTHATDAIKASHPYADFLTSTALSDWNWGTFAQRLDPAWWQRCIYHLQLIAPGWTWLLIGAGFFWGSRRIRFAIALSAITTATGPFAFANLYYVHDYYFVAVAPAVVLMIGLGVATLWQRFGASRNGRVMIALLVVAMLVAQNINFRQGLGRGQMQSRPVPELATLLHDLTGADDNLVIFGREWDPLMTFYAQRWMAAIRGTHEANSEAWSASREALAPDDYTVLVALDSIAGDTSFIHYRCRELGLLTEPLVSTAEADIYVDAATRDRLTPVVAAMLSVGRVLPERPDRMEPGETRLEFVAADWRPLTVNEAAINFPQCEPYPDFVFTRHDPGQMNLPPKPVLLLHPPGGVRFNAVSRDRTVEFDYGIMPEIWEKERDSDGVRFRFFAKTINSRSRIVWEDFVQPRTLESDRGKLTTSFILPAGHTLELQIDAGPDHNPGYDWSYIAGLKLLD